MIAVLMWTGVGLGGLLALLVLLLVLFLLVPVEVEGAWTEARRGAGLAGPGLRAHFDAGEGRVEVRVLGIRLVSWGTQGSGKRTRRKPRRRRKRKGKGLSVSPRKLWRERRRVLAALRAFLRGLHVRRFAATLVIASPDPAWTGWATGMAYAGWGALPTRFRGAVRLRPDFEAEVPRLGAEAVVRLQPLIIAVLAIRLWLVVRRARRPRPRRADRKDRNQPARVAGGRDGAP